jgi:hypothetical protein
MLHEQVLRTREGSVPHTAQTGPEDKGGERPSLDSQSHIYIAHRREVGLGCEVGAMHAWADR